jgi:hypothetical protein
MLREKTNSLAVEQFLIYAAFFNFAMGWLGPDGDVGMQ